jgi:hypothetical protein
MSAVIAFSSWSPHHLFAAAVIDVAVTHGQVGLICAGLIGHGLERKQKVGFLRFGQARKHVVKNDFRCPLAGGVSVDVMFIYPDGSIVGSG